MSENGHDLCNLVKFLNIELMFGQDSRLQAPTNTAAHCGYFMHSQNPKYQTVTFMINSSDSHRLHQLPMVVVDM